MREGQRQKAGLEGTPYTRGDFAAGAREFAGANGVELSPQQVEEVTRRAVEAFRRNNDANLSIVSAFNQLAEEVDRMHQQAMRNVQGLRANLVTPQAGQMWPILPGG
jgi:hypothetical protein